MDLAKYSEVVNERPRLDTLDLLRGIAAIAVVILHANAWHRQSPYLPSADLAVDFFFLLSGYVLGYTYDVRLRAGSFSGEFLRLRMIRLQPMVIAGTAIGLVGYIVINGHSSVDLIPATLSNLTLIPAFVVGLRDAFPLNPPAWSLSVEAMLNIAYALVAARLSTRVLAVICVTSGILLAMSLFFFDALPMLRMSLPDLIGVAARGVFPFSVGILMARTILPKPALGVAWALILVVVLLAVFTPDAKHTTFAAPFYIVAIGLVFPAIVWVGLRCRLNGPMARFAAWAGGISYPLYVIHYPIIHMGQVFFGWLQTSTGILSMPMRLAIMWLFVLLAIAAAQLVLHFFDVPMRRLWAEEAKEAAQKGLTAKAA